MRPSTKIIIGILLSILLVSSAFIIGFSFSERANYSWTSEVSKYAISQENIIPTAINAYRTILLETKFDDFNNEYNVYPHGVLSVTSPTDTQKHNQVCMPEELSKYTEITSSNDTLIIRINMKDLNNKYLTDKDKPIRHIYTSVDGCNFYIYTNNGVDIINSLAGISVEVKNMETDFIKIHSQSNILIDQCKAKRIDPSGKVACNITGSKARELNIDIDNISSWSVRNSDIEVENLTGSRRNMRYTRSAKMMNWYPKTKDAKLEVILNGDTAKVVFP
jgi:hypothetical protein